MQGNWDISDETTTYLGPNQQQDRAVGVCLSASRFRSGTISVDVTFPSADSAARIVVGYNAATDSYYSIGLGGYGRGYVVDSFQPGRGWSALVARGDAAQLASYPTGSKSDTAEQRYHLVVQVDGQYVSLSVNDVRVIETSLPTPLQGDQAGLFAWGNEHIKFTDFEVRSSESRVFVVMQFGEPYDSLYREVIKPVSQEMGFKAVRGDDVFRPGIILQDIWRDIVSSDVIIAEITPANPNVFYELGLAHAMGKQTVLLANRQIDKLPFDVSGYRVIFYDDTIGGKRDVERTLRLHLQNIREGRTMQDAA
jgi:hypothetical protein